jgi:hypothetical protein
MRRMGGALPGPGPSDAPDYQEDLAPPGGANLPDHGPRTDPKTIAAQARPITGQ